MKFWCNAAARLMVFHPKTTHTGSHSTPKDVKNEGRPGYVYENKGTTDKMSEIISAICARLKPLLQKIGVCSTRIAAKFRRPTGAVYVRSRNLVGETGIHHQPATASEGR